MEEFFFFIKKIKKIYLAVAAPCLHAALGFPELRRGGLLVLAVEALLMVVASLVAERGFWSIWASVIVVHGLSFPVACGIFPDPCPLHW